MNGDTRKQYEREWREWEKWCAQRSAAEAVQYGRGWAKLRTVLLWPMFKPKLQPSPVIPEAFAEFLKQYSGHKAAATIKHLVHAVAKHERASPMRHPVVKAVVEKILADAPSPRQKITYTYKDLRRVCHRLSERDRALLLLIVNLVPEGIPVEEILGLRIENVILRRQDIHIHTRNHAGEITPMFPAGTLEYEAVSGYLATRREVEVGWLFPGYNGKSLTRRSLNDIHAYKLSNLLGRRIEGFSFTSSVCAAFKHRVETTSDLRKIAERAGKSVDSIAHKLR